MSILNHQLNSYVTKMKILKSLLQLFLLSFSFKWLVRSGNLFESRERIKNYFELNSIRSKFILTD